MRSINSIIKSSTKMVLGKKYAVRPVSLNTHSTHFKTSTLSGMNVSPE